MDDFRLAYDDHPGDGVPVVLLHGWPGDRQDYRAVLPLLEGRADADARAGAFVRSVNWYRSGSAAVARALAEQTPDPAERIAPPTTILWPEHDPLFPRDWSDAVDHWFAAADLRFVDGIG